MKVSQEHIDAVKQCAEATEIRAHQWLLAANCTTQALPDIIPELGEADSEECLKMADLQQKAAESARALAALMQDALGDGDPEGVTRKDERETVAAIADTLQSDRTKYEAFYRRHCDRFGGMVGVWGVAAEAGAAFERVVGKAELIAGEDFEYIEAVFEFCEAILHEERTAHVTDRLWLETAAGLSIGKHRFARSTK